MKIRAHLASVTVATLTGAVALATSTEASATPETMAPESAQHRPTKGPLPGEALAAHRPTGDGDDGTTIIAFEEFEESISESLQPYSEYPPQVFTFGSS